MEEFIKALKDFEIKEIRPTLERIRKHIDKGYITQEDYFFLEYCYPLVKASCETQKVFLKKENENGY